MTFPRERNDAVGCDLRGGDVTDRFNWFRSTDKPGSTGQRDCNCLTKIVAAKWKHNEPQPMERKLA